MAGQLDYLSPRTSGVHCRYFLITAITTALSAVVCAAPVLSRLFFWTSIIRLNTTACIVFASISILCGLLALFTGERKLHRIISIALCILLSACALEAVIPHDTVRVLPAYMSSMSRLKGIGLSLMLYAQDNNGAYPPNLQTLVNASSLDPMEIVDPVAPLTANATLPDAFVYYGAGKTSTCSSKTILAADPLINDTDQVNVVFADGSMKRYPRALAATILPTTRP